MPCSHGGTRHAVARQPLDSWPRFCIHFWYSSRYTFEVPCCDAIFLRYRPKIVVPTENLDTVCAKGCHVTNPRKIVPDSAVGVSFVGHSDQGGRGDATQVMINKSHAFVCHVFSGGFSVIDVTDPRDPRTVNFIPTPANTWSIHLQTHGDLMLVINEFDFYSQYQRESDYYGRSINDTVGRPFTAGIRVYDISDPASPREIGFMPVDGKGVHRIWWDGGRYAYASVLPWGFTDHIFAVIDVAEP